MEEIIPDRVEDIFPESSKSTDIPQLETSAPNTTEVLSTDREKDCDFARKNMVKTIETAMGALESLSKLAETSDHPRVYEVLNGLIKVSMDSNKDLIDIHKKDEKKDESNNSGKSVVNHNQAIFVGSTDEILKILKRNNDGS